MPRGSLSRGEDDKGGSGEKTEIFCRVFHEKNNFFIHHLHVVGCSLESNVG